MDTKQNNAISPHLRPVAQRTRSLGQLLPTPSRRLCYIHCCIICVTTTLQDSDTAESPEPLRLLLTVGHPKFLTE